MCISMCSCVCIYIYIYVCIYIYSTCMCIYIYAHLLVIDHTVYVCRRKRAEGVHHAICLERYQGAAPPATRCLQTASQVSGRPGHPPGVCFSRSRSLAGRGDGQCFVLLEGEQGPECAS